MTPKRRQGSGRAAFDHISKQLTESLSTLSKITASQAVIGLVAQGEHDRAAATLARLDNDLLTAITDVAGAMHNLGKYALDVRKIEGNSP